MPLTFSQQAFWRALQRFGMKHNTRFCANVMRLSGPLNVDCLKLAFAELVMQHEVLRVRILAGETAATQVIMDGEKLELEVQSKSHSSPVITGMLAFRIGVSAAV